MSRRSVLRAVGAGAAAPLLAGASSRASSAASDSWTIVALPDTQYYANNERRYRFAVDQTDWIAENADAENIAFVSHEGDVVHEGDQTEQWDRMDDAMATLDGVVPYSTLPGNHDYADTRNRSSGLDNYVDYFGASRFDGYDWFGGTGPSDEEANSYQLFSAGGYDFLHLALEWEPRDETLEWARDVLDRFPERPAVLTTHAYLTDGDREGGDESNPGRARFIEEENGDGNSGEQVWRRLVAPNSQVFMVLSGHFHENLNQDADPQTSGEYHQVSENDAGEDVYEMLANYQKRDGSGFSLLRRISFEPGSGDPDRISVSTYNTYKDEYETDDNSEFAFDLDFDERFAQESSTDPTERFSFEQGADGYEGTSDTNLREANPQTGYGDASTVTVDTKEPQDSDNRAQALVRFDGVIGDGDGQVPPNATVNSATLTVETVDEGSGGAVHRLLREWSESDTWESFGGGVSADGSDATADPEAKAEAVSEGPTEIDVTASVREWVGGEPNHGWAILPLGDDGWDFSTAEGDAPPQLTVTFEPGDGGDDDSEDGTGDGSDGGDGTGDGGDGGDEPNEPLPGDADGDGDVDDADVDLAQRHVANEDVDIDREAADMDDDGEIDITDVVEIVDETGGR
ncbi:DNRLRE domain-containing protein [Halorubrum depositum]|uniref:DNRLRE domain-containing protein n=1 Tax=Halorubrum depositum TaxID=2583992 RepID=UPI0019D6976A|nr:DNRLRE domain-containing protein [Halorubrum depositum]